MSDKKRVYNVTASFGCDCIISCETVQEVIAHLEAEMEAAEECGMTDVGESITITIGEMTPEEIAALPEFDGC